MELKVKAVEAVEEKSMQEVEKELLDKHEEKLIEEDKAAEETPQVKMDFAEDGSDKTVNEAKETSEEKPEPVQEPAELSEEDVLS